MIHANVVHSTMIDMFVTHNESEVEFATLIRFDIPLKKARSLIVDDQRYDHGLTRFSGGSRDDVGPDSEGDEI